MILERVAMVLGFALFVLAWAVVLLHWPTVLGAKLHLLLSVIPLGVIFRALMIGSSPRARSAYAVASIALSAALLGLYAFQFAQ